MNNRCTGLVSTFLCGTTIGLVLGVILGVYLWRVYGGGIL